MMVVQLVLLVFGVVVFVSAWSPCHHDQGRSFLERPRPRHRTKRFSPPSLLLLSATPTSISLDTNDGYINNDNNNNDNNDTLLFDEKAIRSTYDAWRPFYGKGEFDSQRYEIFQQHYKILTKANIKARNDAAQNNRPIPPWMQLNQYADWTQEEYNIHKNSMNNNNDKPEHNNNNKSTTSPPPGPSASRLTLSSYDHHASLSPMQREKSSSPKRQNAIEVSNASSLSQTLKTQSSSPSSSSSSGLSLRRKQELAKLDASTKSNLNDDDPTTTNQRKRRDDVVIHSKNLPYIFEPKTKQDLNVIENKPSCAELLFHQDLVLGMSFESRGSGDSDGDNGSSSQNPQQWKGPTIKVLDDVEVDYFVDNATERLFLY